MRTVRRDLGVAIMIGPKRVSICEIKEGQLDGTLTMSRPGYFQKEYIFQNIPQRHIEHERGLYWPGMNLNRPVHIIQQDWMGNPNYIGLNRNLVSEYEQMRTAYALANRERSDLRSGQWNQASQQTQLIGAKKLVGQAVEIGRKAMPYVPVQNVGNQRGNQYDD